MAVMTGLYAAIGRELWGQQAIGEATAVQVESIKSKRRVSFITWVPKEQRQSGIMGLLGSDSILKYVNIFEPTTSKKIEKNIFYIKILHL